jgi:hypothetical protein
MRLEDLGSLNPGITPEISKPKIIMTMIANAAIVLLLGKTN